MGMDFRSAFRDALNKCGLSQRKFADLVGMSQANVNKILTGNHSAPPPPLDRLDAWADALGLTGEAREEFLRAGQIAHVPKRIRQELIVDDDQAKRQQWKRYLEDLTPAQLDLLGRLDQQLRAEVDQVFRGPDEIRRAARVGRQVWRLLDQDQDTVLVPGAVATRAGDVQARYDTQAGELAQVKSQLAQAQQDLADMAHLAAEVERLRRALAKATSAPASTDDGFDLLDKELARHDRPLAPTHPSVVPSAAQRPTD